MSVPVTFSIKMEMPLEEWKDHCWGSGWTTWEWWYSASATNDGISAEWYEDADDPDSRIEKDFRTWQQLADVASQVAASDGFVADQLSRSDLDADAMDRIMQTAFIGEVIYG
jgi:hypothetical protein